MPHQITPLEHSPHDLPEPLSRHSHQAPPPPPPPHEHKKPISPPLDSLPYQQAPRSHKLKALVLAVIVATIFTAVVGFILYYFYIPVNVILPVLAPIWVGSITLFYSLFSKN